MKPFNEPVHAVRFTCTIKILFFLLLFVQKLFTNLPLAKTTKKERQ